jgi:hypothetical protein
MQYIRRMETSSIAAMRYVGTSTERLPVDTGQVRLRGARSQPSASGTQSRTFAVAARLHIRL